MKVLKIKYRKEEYTFEIATGSLTVNMDWITEEGEKQGEELFSLDWPGLLKLRDFLNEYAPPEQYQLRHKRPVYHPVKPKKEE